MSTDTTPRRGRPRLSRRTAERVQISLLPEDREALDQIATELGEPGMPPNRSAAFRRVLREWLATYGTKPPENGTV